MSKETAFVDLHEGNDISLHGAALAAGLGLILMFVPAIFANFLVINGIVVPGDATATAAKVQVNEMQFRLGILSILFVIVLDVIVAWGLYVFYKPANKSLSLLTGWFRLVYAALFGVALFNLLNVLPLVGAAEFAGMETQVLIWLNAFSDQWSVGLSVFGVHLILLGYVAFKSGYTPKILGILLVIAGLGYVVDSLAALMLPQAGIAIGMFTFFGEMFLAVWLVVKALRSKTWPQAVLQTAS